MAPWYCPHVGGSGTRLTRRVHPAGPCAVSLPSERLFEQGALLSSGLYTIQRNGTMLIRGRDTETTTTISLGHEIGPAACTGALGAATYRWSLRAGLLHLTTVREGCLGRHVVLTTHPLKKVG